MKDYNAIYLSGQLYDFDLKEDVNKDGVNVIMGSVSLLVNEEKGTVVDARYYAAPVYKSGKVNATYGMLQKINTGEIKTVKEAGKNAGWLSLSGNIDVSYFVPKGGDGEVARSQKVRGSFINANTKRVFQNSWKLDFLITSVDELEADEEKNLDRMASVNGYLVDSYREQFLEVNFKATKEAAINYILGLEPTREEPYFVSTWGEIGETTRTVLVENAFGEPEKKEYSTTIWEITGMNPENYEVFSEDTITQENYTVFLSNLKELKDKEKNKSNEVAAEDLPF